MLEDQILKEGCQLDDGPYCMIRTRDVAAYPNFNRTEDLYDTDEDHVTNVM